MRIINMKRRKKKDKLLKAEVVGDAIPPKNNGSINRVDENLGG